MKLPLLHFHLGSQPLSPSRCGDNRPKLCLGRFDSRNAMTPRRNLPQDRTRRDGGANKEKVLRDDNDRCADVFMTSATLQARSRAERALDLNVGP